MKLLKLQKVKHQIIEDSQADEECRGFGYGFTCFKRLEKQRYLRQTERDLEEAQMMAAFLEKNQQKT